MSSKQRVSIQEFAKLIKKYYNSGPITREDIKYVAKEENVCVPNAVWEYKVERGLWEIPVLKTEKETIIEKETPVIMKNESAVVMNFIPPKDKNYVAWGHFKDVESILKSKIFYPIFITGLSGNGKTTMVQQVCAKLKKEFVRANITIETDEDDLLGGYRLVNGETVWHDGPVVEAMKRGALLLLDEVDLASHKIMCLQPILEGKPIFLKKTGDLVYPKEGFNVVATANTKGKGSDDGRFMGTNVLNEAFLDRFPATMYQDYASQSVEIKILNKKMSSLDMQDEKFTENLAKWGDLSRRLFESGGIDEVITTRRLLNIVEAYSIFGTKSKAISLGIERFDDIVRDGFMNLYTKIDTGVQAEEEARLAAEMNEEVLQEETSPHNPPWK